MLLSLLQSNYKMLLKMHLLLPVIQLENQNCENMLPPNSEETVAFARMRSFQDTLKFQEWA
jgi:hypothetical protein